MYRIIVKPDTLYSSFSLNICLIAQHILTKLHFKIGYAEGTQPE